MNKNFYLEAMGIQPWQLKSTAKKTEVNDLDHLTWPELAARISQCTLCGLEKSRTQTVFGVGNQQADLMIIGEAPGLNEDKRGEPFVGRAGQLLNCMLESIGLTREKIFIANILKCRPPNNRDPQVAEVTSCTPYLVQQINLLQPKLILAVGRIAAQYLLQTKSALGQLRSQLHHLPTLNVPVIITYHPAYLLRSPKDKKKAYADLVFTQQTLNSVG